MGTYSFKLNDDEASVGSVLNTIIEEAASSAQKEVSKLSATLEGLSKKSTAVEAKIASRQRIYETQRSREMKKRDDWQKASAKTLDAREKFLRRSNEASVIKDKMRDIQTELSTHGGFLGNFSEIYSDGAFVNRAFMLRSVEQFIDKRSPITYADDPVTKEATVSWVTNNIRMKDGVGGYLPHSFGKFSVIIRYNYYRGVAQVTGSFKPVGGNCRYSEYTHPHIRDNGEPCLGNVQRMLLGHMKNQDVANVVYTVTEYLISYNHTDPFARLSLFGVNNRWEHKKCSCGKSLYIDGCAECENKETTNTCGLSFSECMRYHRNSNPSQEKGQCILGEFVDFIKPAEVAVTNLKTLGVVNEGNQ